MEEGNLLGNIILRDGIKIDPNKFFEIHKIDIPRNKEVQSFLGRINFLEGSFLTQ